MKNVTLDAFDRQCIQEFKRITSQVTFTHAEVAAWVSTVKNPAICDGGGQIAWRKSNQNLLNGRRLSHILKPVYGEARTIAETQRIKQGIYVDGKGNILAQQTTRRGRKPKEVQASLNKYNPKIRKAIEVLAEHFNIK